MTLQNAYVNNNWTIIQRLVVNVCYLQLQTSQYRTCVECDITLYLPAKFIKDGTYFSSGKQKAKIVYCVIM